MTKMRVLVVDDSALFRTLMAQVLGSDPGIEVIGTAADPTLAWPIIKAQKPDVVTLDIEMPRMDGLTFLDGLMTHAPLPVVVVSSLTARGCETTLRAFELGAVDVVEKPTTDLRESYGALAEQLIAKVKHAAQARPRRGAARSSVPPAAVAHSYRTTDRVIAIGASTGGTEALLTVLGDLPPDAPGVVIVQHMPARFTRSFAERLNRLCAIRVKEAEDGDRVLVGQALLAPGDKHMRVRRSGALFHVVLSDEAPHGGHRPSVDVLFHSCATAAGRNAVGVILTGMGADGADGLGAMHKSGAVTFAQDEQSCVVFGMPKEAVARGAVDKVLPLEMMGQAVLRVAQASV
jgi:two-component system chemotaxis response regulator CheB